MADAKIQDLTAENLTRHVIKTCTENVSDPRVAELISGLVQHLHDYVRAVRLKQGEWEAGWRYLTEVGQACTPERQEMILLSDVLGVSALVDTLNSAQARSDAATESSVLGPFHSDETRELKNGQAIASAGAVGEPMLIYGTVRATDGSLVEGATVDVWETNGNGFYDMQDPHRDGPDCRGVFRSDGRGRYCLLGVKSVDYNIPSDGPVGQLLDILDRNITRPAHVHFQVKHPSCVDLTTALYAADSKNIIQDPVFGVKASLVRDFKWATELPEIAKDFGDLHSTLEKSKWNIKDGIWVLENDFVLLSTEQT